MLSWCSDLEALTFAFDKRLNDRSHSELVKVRDKEMLLRLTETVVTSSKIHLSMSKTSVPQRYHVNMSGNKRVVP